LCAFALLTVFLIQSTGELSPKFKIFLVCGAGIVFFFVLLDFLLPILAFFTQITSASEFSALFTLLYKALGIAMLISVSASICRDLGEESVASKLEVCGKGAILSLALPLFEKIMEFVGEMTR